MLLQYDPVQCSVYKMYVTINFVEIT